MNIQGKFLLKKPPKKLLAHQQMTLVLLTPNSIEEMTNGLEKRVALNNNHK